jgi:hypothetical protein
MDVDLGVEVSEALENGGEYTEYRGNGAVEAEIAPQETAAAQVVLQGVPQLENIIGIAVKDSAGVGKADGALISGEKLLVEFVFQALDGTCQPGGSDVAGLAGSAEMECTGEMLK